MSAPEKKKNDLTQHEKEVAILISEGKGWTEAISTAYSVSAVDAREIYRRDIQESNFKMKKISLLVNRLLKGPKRGYVYLPKPPVSDLEEDDLDILTKPEAFWPEHKLQAGKPLQIYEGFSGYAPPKIYRRPPREASTPPSRNKFFEVNTNMDPINQFFSSDEAPTYGNEEGNKTEVKEDVTDNYLVRQLKDLYQLALDDKKYKEAKDCLELLGRIGGQIGEKVKKESVVTNKTVSEASEEFLHASKVLGLDLPHNVTNIFEAQRKHK